MALSAGGVVVSLLVGFWPLFAFGLIQGLWVIPIYLHYRRKGETETAKGLLLVAGLVFLLNAGCWGVILSGKMRIAG